MDSVDKAIQVTSVFPGRFGGAIVKGVVVGERAELRCVINWKKTINPPKPGEFWRVRGRFSTDAIHGQQLHVTDCCPVKLPEESYVASLLVRHPAFRGFALGKKKVKDLLNEYGAEGLVQHLNNADDKALSAVIHPAIAASLVEAWAGLNNEVETINFLLEHRFSPELARKVIYLCRDNAVERLRANPYALVCFGDISRSIWRTVEACARRMNMPLDHEHRLVGAIEHVLYENLRRGHTAMPLDDLLSGAEKLLKTKKGAEQGVALAVKRKAACVLNGRSGHLIQLYGPALIEFQLEGRIEKLLTGPKQMGLYGGTDDMVKKLVDDYCSTSADSGFRFTAKQREAIFMALTSKLSVLTGFGGTGKTTILRAIIDIAKIMRREAHLLALAGKAKERAKQATGHRAFTIHAFVAVVKKGAEDIKLESNPLIIIDEASMVDVALFNELLSFLDGREYSLLTVGDTAQISPVGFGLVWHRLAAMSNVPVVHLDEVHRQQSRLHEIAMAVRRFDDTSVDIDLKEWRGEDEGVYWFPAGKKDLRAKLLLLKWLEGEGHLPEAQILTPHMAERMPDGGAKINRYIQKELVGDKDGIRLGMNWIRVGDPVIVSENSYDLGLFNGTTGRLLRVEVTADTLAGVFTMEGRDGEVRLTTEDLLDVGMKPAYAISIHKSQGSEYPATIITCVADSPMVERSLIYTALTRAKKLCLIVGSPNLFRAAVSKPPRAETLCAGFYLSRLHPKLSRAS